MVFLKTCPKCEGEIYLQRDPQGTYWQCRRCGRIPTERGNLNLSSDPFKNIITQ